MIRRMCILLALVLLASCGMAAAEAAGGEDEAQWMESGKLNAYQPTDDELLTIRVATTDIILGKTTPADLPRRKRIRPQKGRRGVRRPAFADMPGKHTAAFSDDFSNLQVAPISVRDASAGHPALPARILLKTSKFVFGCDFLIANTTFRK